MYDDIGEGHDLSMDFIGKYLPGILRVVTPWQKLANGMKNDYRMERTAYPFQTEHITQPGAVFVAEKDEILPFSTTKRVYDRLSNKDSQLITVPGVKHDGLLTDEILDTACRKAIQLGGL